MTNYTPFSYQAKQSNTLIQASGEKSPFHLKSMDLDFAFVFVFMARTRLVKHSQLCL
jgi:hypothetical protein